ncbi:hypothetical protein D3H55_21420 [Bacillus salacetis]|uniref:DUF4025 domain-containing protein n=1 Tax=Bacillus salacetis TaxID=2315464 RepID=A0A3A1QNI2_9BACI|nr:hypothetical protein [Bacillus salacetis]RIW28625.1 hypothetical protein D3H55_21420 [Bacillus salacetis]
MNKEQPFDKDGNKRMGALAGHGAYLDANEPYPGDSVNEHQDQEFANEIVGREEIKQQNDNL